MRTCHIICDADIVYENGAVVRTAFITSYGGDVVARTAPDLGRSIKRAVEQIKAETRRELPKYTYPDHILTAAMLQKYSHYGVEFSVSRYDCLPIAGLDAQKQTKKSIFGGGLLLSERAAAERAAAHVWQLSAREKTMVAALSAGGGDEMPHSVRTPTRKTEQNEIKTLSIFDLLEQEVAGL